jgi:uncharacterized protein YjbI with pentapeptide repeats
MDFDQLIFNFVEGTGYTNLAEMIFDFISLNSLVSSDYKKTKLTRSSLQRVTFQGDISITLDFANSIMFNTKFDNSIIISTSFNSCYFNLASLVNCSITNTSFKKANFKYADLRFTKFDTCDFEDVLNIATCNCSGTDFTNSVNFPYSTKTEFIIALSNYEGKADGNTLWIDGSPLLS